MKNQKARCKRRLPTLFEVLSDNGKFPVDLINFHAYTSKNISNLKYLKFFFDLNQYYILSNKHRENEKKEILGEEKKDVIGFNSSNNFDLVVNDKSFTSLLVDNGNIEKVNLIRDDSLSLIDSMQKLTRKTNLSNEKTESEKKKSIFLSFFKFFSSVKTLKNKPDKFKLEESQFDSSDDSNYSYNCGETYDNMSSNLILTLEILENLCQEIVNNYFTEGSEMFLDLPAEMNERIRRMVLEEKRFDLEVFNESRSYVFVYIETKIYPEFLLKVVYSNLFGSIKFRMIFAFITLFFAFWSGFIFLFLNFNKLHKVFLSILFFFGFHLLNSSFYCVDFILTFMKMTESLIDQKLFSFRKIEDVFVYNVLFKKSIWLLSLTMIFTAFFSCFFFFFPNEYLKILH